MLKMLLIVFSVIGVFLISISKVLAGGGLIYTDVSWIGRSLYPGESYNATIFIGLDGRVLPNDPAAKHCQHCSIKVMLQNPQGNDVIVQSSNETDNNGKINATITSYIPGNRVLYSVAQLPDGTSYTSSVNILNYYDIAYSQPTSMPTSTVPTLTPTSHPVPTAIPTPSYQQLFIKFEGQKNIADGKREVFLSWNAVLGTVKYNVYIKPMGAQNWGSAVLGTGLTRGSIWLNTDLNYYIKVQSCKTTDNCFDSVNKLFLPSERVDSSLVSASSQSAVASNSAVSTKRSVPISGNQSGAEGRFNQITSWFRTIFPLFSK